MEIHLEEINPFSGSGLIGFILRVLHSAHGHQESLPNVEDRRVEKKEITESLNDEWTVNQPGAVRSHDLYGISVSYSTK